MKPLAFKRIPVGHQFVVGVVNLKGSLENIENKQYHEDQVSYRTGQEQRYGEVSSKVWL